MCFSEKLILTNPVSGRVANLVETPDTYFASGLMGAGAVLFPREGVVRAPCDGMVEFVLPKKYALGLRGEQGLELVLQVGIDTGPLNGRGFLPLVDPGAKVRQGQALVRFDLPTMQAAGIDTATPLVVNLPASQVHPLATGDLDAGRDLLEITL